MRSVPFFIVFTSFLAVALFSACAHAPYSEPAAITDEAILIDFRNALNQRSDINVGNIEADSNRGVLTVSGLAASHEDKDTVLRIARQIRGVRDVIDNIVLRQ